MKRCSESQLSMLFVSHRLPLAENNEALHSPAFQTGIKLPNSEDKLDFKPLPQRTPLHPSRSTL